MGQLTGVSETQDGWDRVLPPTPHALAQGRDRVREALMAERTGPGPGGLLVPIRKGSWGCRPRPPSNASVRQDEPRDNSGLVSLKNCVTLKIRCEHEEYIFKKTFFAPLTSFNH